MTMVMIGAADGCRQILNVGKLAGLRCARKVRGKLVQLIRRGGRAVGGGRLGRALQILGDLLRHLAVLRRIGLLKLLKRAHQLGERRKAATVL